MYQDKVYGLPWISQPVLLYYNPALFDAAGIAYPDDTWDWDKFASTRRRHLTKDDQYGFSGQRLATDPHVHLAGRRRGHHRPTWPRHRSTSPEAIAGAEFYKSLIFNAACCPTEDTIAEQGFSEMFKAGKVAMFMGGASDTFEDADGNVLDIRASVVPKGPRSATTFAWTASTVVNAKANATPSSPPRRWSR